MTDRGDYDLRLYAKGRAFHESRYDLRHLEAILTNYRQIVDGALPIVLGRRTLTARLKSEIKYGVRVKEGSIEVLLDLIQPEHVVAAYAALSDGGHTLAHLMSNLIRAGVDLRRAFVKMAKKGLKGMIHIDVNIDNSVKADYNSGTIYVKNPSAVLCAESTRAPIDRLISAIDGNELESVDLGSGGEDLELRESDQEITGADRHELDTEMEVVGRINMVKFDSHRGTLVTGDSCYPVTWDDALRQKIHDLADREGILFKVRPVIDKRQFQTEPVGFTILSCRNPQQNLI